MPSLENIEKNVSKYEVGLVFFEPQNFRGEGDEPLLFEAYGPTSSGTSDTYVYDFIDRDPTSIFTYSADSLMRGFYVHEPVYSPNGEFSLMAAGGISGNEFNSPGYGVGIVLFNNN